MEIIHGPSLDPHWPLIADLLAEDFTKFESLSLSSGGRGAHFTDNFRDYILHLRPYRSPCTVACLMPDADGDAPKIVAALLALSHDDADLPRHPEDDALDRAEAALAENQAAALDGIVGEDAGGAVHDRLTRFKGAMRSHKGSCHVLSMIASRARGCGRAMTTRAIELGRENGLAFLTASANNAYVGLCVSLGAVVVRTCENRSVRALARGSGEGQEEWDRRRIYMDTDGDAGVPSESYVIWDLEDHLGR